VQKKKKGKDGSAKNSSEKLVTRNSKRKKKEGVGGKGETRRGSGCNRSLHCSRGQESLRLGNQGEDAKGLKDE